MNQNLHERTSRREFLKTSGRLAATTALAGVPLPHVHAAGGDTLQVALIGCGGRGTGATVGFAAEILATVATGGFSFLDAPPERLTAPDCPVPYDTRLLESVLPSKERIRETIDAMLAY